MLRSLLPILLLVSSVSAGAAEEGTAVRLRLETLSPKERLSLPWYRVPVGPGVPLRLAGRAGPVRFEEREDGLFVDADGLDECEEPVREGRTVAIRLDPASGDTPGEWRRFTFVSGDPERGEAAWFAVSLDILKGQVGGTSIRCFDYDADGVWFTRWVDFIEGSISGAPYPVCPFLVVGRHAWTADFDSAGRSLRIRPVRLDRDRQDYPSFREVTEGIEHLNRLRAGMNLPPVALSVDASRHAMLHLRYCAVNGGNGHLEERDLPGYTTEGTAAGLNSIGHFGGTNVVAAMDGHLGTLLHRLDLLDPRTTEIGIASASNRVWIHTEWSKERAWRAQGPLIFPGPFGHWRSGVYTKENPDARPEGVTHATGLPVTVSWFGMSGVSGVRVRLLHDGRTVPGWKNDSEQRDLRTIHGSIRAAIMAEKPLDSGRHVLIVEWRQNDRDCRLEHEFRIGR